MDARWAAITGSAAAGDMEEAEAVEEEGAERADRRDRIGLCEEVGRVRD